MTHAQAADRVVAEELRQTAERLHEFDPARYDLLATMLQALVPLRMLELRDHGQEQLAALARAQVETIAACGDNLLYRGPNTREAFAALLTAVACGALVAEGGVTMLGLHWCATPHAFCPKPTRLLGSGEA